jgi:parallel beta-helix repeat protein
MLIILIIAGAFVQLAESVYSENLKLTISEPKNNFTTTSPVDPSKVEGLTDNSFSNGVGAFQPSNGVGAFQPSNGVGAFQPSYNTGWNIIPNNSTLADKSNFGDNANASEFVIGLNQYQANSLSLFSNIMTKYNAQIVNTISANGKVVAIVVKPPPEDKSSFIQEAQASGLSRYIEPRTVFHVDFVPNDPYWVNQWGPQKIKADFAWNTTKGNSTIIVAVIDTGIDYTHPDLAANYVPLGYDWVNNDSYPLDDFGHGTHCAGIIAAQLNNSLGIAGLAQVKIMAEKALDSNGGGYSDQLANAIYDAVNKGAKILSCSWGSASPSSVIHDAILYAVSHGVLVLAAAGNSGSNTPSYPGAYEETVAVSATDSADNPATFTTYGDWVDVAAPGVDILSTMPTYHVTMNNYGYGMNYSYMSGTSMACPMAAGVAALILSRFPNWTATQVRSNLEYTADDLGALGFDQYYGHGRINAQNAVEQLQPVHDVVISQWQTPQYAKVGSSSVFNITVFNRGQLSESGLQVKILADNSVVNSTSIASLSSCASASSILSWTPGEEGTYNLTSYVVPVSGQSDTKNNVIMKNIVAVLPPPDAGWTLFATDPDAGVGTSLKAIYAQVYSGIIYFKVQHYRNWTTISTDINDGIMIDADQNPNTGDPDGMYPNQKDDLGADYYLIVGQQGPSLWNRATGTTEPAAYLDAPDNSNTFIVGVFAADIQTNGLLDFAIADPVSNWDWMPKTGYCTLPAVSFVHELAAKTPFPSNLQLGLSSTINATVQNFGSSTETNVSLQLQVDGVTIASKTIPTLPGGSNFTLSYVWTPNAPGNYNITARVTPVAGETIVSNNVRSKVVLVFIGGNTVFTIEDSTFTIQGNLLVQDNATLILRNCNLILNQSSYYQFEIETQGNGIIICSNTNISSNYNFDMNLYGSYANFTRTNWNVYTYTNGNSINVTDSVGLGSFWISNKGYFYNCTGNGYIDGTTGSQVVISNCNIDNAYIETSNSVFSASSLRNGYINYFNTFSSLTVTSGNFTNLTIINSNLQFGLWFVLGGSNATFTNSQIYYCYAYSNSGIVLHNCTLSDLYVADQTVVSAYDSQIYYCYAYSNSGIFLHNCNLSSLYIQDQTVVSAYDSALGYLGCENLNNNIVILSNVTVSGFYSYYSNVYFSGNFSFMNGYVSGWQNSNIIRTFYATVKNEKGNPAANINLKLLSGSTVVWSGVSDSLGQAYFNVTFTDANYSSGLWLEASNGSFVAAAKMAFLSNSSVTLNLHLPTVHNLNTGLNYSSIQEALDASETLNGHTILVDNGTYYENVVVNKSVALIGQNMSATVVDGNSNGAVLTINVANVTVAGFTLRNSGTSGMPCGVYVNYAVSRANVTGNIILNNGYGVYLDQSSTGTIVDKNTITNNSYGGIYSYSSSSNTITANNLTYNTWDGIDLYYSTNCVISGNNISNGNGIVTYSSSNCSIIGNTISNTTWDGIDLYYGINCLVSGNTISNGGGGGIYTYSSSNCSIIGNTISNTTWAGIDLDYSTNNTISLNSMGQSYGGLYLYYSSTNVVCKNTLNGNSLGVYLYNSSSNQFYLNNFNSISQVSTYNSINTWDNGVQGNYWSNYNGTDSNHDGIGDTPYVIDAYNIDNYPLMSPWTPALNQFNISASAGANGAISPSGNVSVNFGGSQSFNITANAGYHIVDVVVDSVSQGAVSSYTFTNVTATHTITATFAINTYSITVTQGANGVIAPGTTTVNYGGSQSFTITPNSGYYIASITTDIGSVTVTSPSGQTVSFTNVQAAHTITATFAINTYSITVTQGANGQIAPGTSVVNYGATPSFTVTASTGYHILDVQVDGVSVLGSLVGNVYTFPAVSANHAIAASFAINTFTITASAGANGAISPSGSVSVNYGSDQSFTITANAHYHVADVLVDGSSVGAVTSYIFHTVTAAHTISASFAIDTNTISASAGANGAISPSGNVSVNFGGSQSFTITANTGYQIVDVVVDSVSQGAVSSYTFTNVTAAHTITATFTLTPTPTPTPTPSPTAAPTPAPTPTAAPSPTPTPTPSPPTPTVTYNTTTTISTTGVEHITETNNTGISIDINGKPGTNVTVTINVYNSNPQPSATLPEGVTLTHYSTVAFNMDPNNFTQATVTIRYSPSDVQGLTPPYAIYKYIPENNSYVELFTSNDLTSQTLTITLNSPNDPLFAIGNAITEYTSPTPTQTTTSTGGTPLFIYLVAIVIAFAITGTAIALIMKKRNTH